MTVEVGVASNRGFAGVDVSTSLLPRTTTVQGTKVVDTRGRIGCKIGSKVVDSSLDLGSKVDDTTHSRTRT